MITFAVSDYVWNAIIGGAVVLVLALINRSGHKQTAEKLKEIAEVGETTHLLVNSSMGAQLHLHMISTRRLADLTNNEADIKAALLAEKLYHEHEIKQAKVDAKAEAKADAP